jgi:methylated-DNA-protein-cysteine methyltransferase-like protein
MVLQDRSTGKVHFNSGSSPLSRKYHRAARQVACALHSSAVKENLPWHRVINSRGFISLKPGAGFELQRTILSGEGIVFSSDGSVDLAYYLWKPKRSDHL